MQQQGESLLTLGNPIKQLYHKIPINARFFLGRCGCAVVTRPNQCTNKLWLKLGNMKYPGILFLTLSFVYGTIKTCFVIYYQQFESWLQSQACEICINIYSYKRNIVDKCPR